MANDLEYSLGLDVSPLQKAGAAVARFGDDTVKVLNRKFSGADVFKGLVQGLGIASAQQIAEKLVEPFRASAESAKNIADWTERAANVTERLLELRRTDEQQLEALEKQAMRLREELGKPVSLSPWESLKIAITNGPLRALDQLKERRAEMQAEADAQRAALLAEKELEAERQRQAMQRKREQEAKQADDEALRMQKERYREEERRAAAVKSLAEFEREQRRAKMTDEERITDLEKERRQVAKEIAEYEKFAREGGELTALGTEQLLGLKTKQRDLEKEIGDITARKVAAEQAIGDVIASNVEKWREFTVAINSFGRGDKELSDRELQKKIQNLNQVLFESEVGRAGRVQVGNEFGIDPGAFLSQRALDAARAELRLREDTRRNVEFFGRERAADLGNLSDQRLDQILRGSVTQQERFTTALERLERHFQAIPETLKSLRE